MARGHTDYGQGGAVNIVSPVYDLGELAARLGSVDVYDRSGYVIFLTKFDAGLTEITYGVSGSGAAVAVDTSRSFRGGQSLVLTGGSDGGKWAAVGKRTRPISITRMGLEYTYSINADVDRTKLAIGYNDGTSKYVWEIHASKSDNDLKILKADGSTESILNYDFGNGDLDLWHTVKVVVDLDTKSYLRLLFNDRSLSLADYSAKITADTSDERIESSHFVFSSGATNAISNLDSLIITINEPE